MNCPNCGQENREGATFCDACGIHLLTTSEPSALPLNPLSTSINFVGRQRELGELGAVLEDALSGQGRLVMLVGEPGMGKTRTAQELAAYATSRGALVLGGRCYAAEGAPPYWPWVQAIRSYIQQSDPERLSSEMGVGASDIAMIVSEVTERLPDLESPPALEPQEARFRLFDSITTFLKRACQAQPLVVTLDNLHWADRPSLQLLEFLAQELGECPLLVVGTYRDTELTRRHPLTQTLGEVARDPLFQRIPLRGLSAEEVGRYMEVTSGSTSPQDLIAAVHTQTEGNPLFMTQVVQLLAQEGELTSERVAGTPDRRIQIPAGVHEAIGRRMNLLSEKCNQVLTVASVVGREFELRLLERLEEVGSVDPLLEALEEALAARVIEEVPPAAGRFRFTHVLIQNTLALELSAVRQARLHQHIGEALEELYGGDGEDHAAELAYHFAEAAAVIGSEKLVKYSLLAGERALATYAHEEALIYFDRGLLAKEGQPMDAETAALLCGLGHAQTATLERHQLHDAVSSLRRAFDYYAEVENVNLAVAVAQFPVNSAPGQRTGLAQLIGDALKLVPPESLEAGHLLSRYGRVLGIEEGNYEGAEEALGRALTIAQQEGDAALEMWTLANSAQVALYDLRFQEALEKGLRAIELAQKANDPRAEVFARFYASAVLRRIGDLPGWRQQTSAMVAPAERLRDRYWLIGVYESQGHLLRIEGQWQAARDVYDRGLAVSPREPRLLARRALLEYEEGEFGQGEAFLRRLIEAMGMTAPGPALVYGYTAVVIGFAARITGMVDRFDVAQTAAETVLSSAHVNPNYAMQARAGLALLAVQRGDVRAAREQYESLKSMQGLGLYSGFICFDHLLGLLAHAMGNLDQATAHFEDTLAFCRKAGYRTELAWSCCDYADALFQRDGRGDHMQAMSLLEESLSISSELGMRPLLARVQERLDRTESQPGPSPEYPDGLTPREVEVLCLIARGRSNRELAAELVLSLRTVERHITNIYGKISARGRADATAYVLGHDLIDQK